MNAISVEALSPSAYYDQSVMLEDQRNGYILTAPGIPVSAELLARLRKWSYASIYSDGQAQSKPKYQEIQDQDTGGVALQEDVADQKLAEDTNAAYQDALSFVNSIFEEYREEGSLNPQQISDHIKGMVDQVRTLGHHLLAYSKFKNPFNSHLVSHSVNTTILAISIGLLAKRAAHQLIELGTAAMLHDIGMLKIPAEKYENAGELDGKERQTLMAHTVLGYRALKLFPFPESIPLTALEHHENVDGSGYPQQLKAERIHDHAKLVAVVGSYDAVTSARPFRLRSAGHQAIVDLLKHRDKRYDGRMVMALVRVLSVHPIGSFVELTNGGRGMVYRSAPDNPRFPIVKVLQDDGGVPLGDPVYVQTSEDSGVAVRRSLDAEEAGAVRQ